MTEVHPKNGTDFKLEELTGFVGGHIELVQTIGRRTMVLDEEGKLKGKPVMRRPLTCMATVVWITS